MDELKQREIEQTDGAPDWRRKTPESFEVTEYGPEKEKEDGWLKEFSVIKEIVSELSQRTPAHGFQVKAGAGRLQLIFHCYEMQLPHRMAEVAHQAKSLLDAAAKELKKEFKARTGDSLKLKERKEEANFTVEKVSLNERYYFVSWRVYELE
jgi:hypothetical protein